MVLCDRWHGSDSLATWEPCHPRAVPTGSIAAPAPMRLVIHGLAADTSRLMSPFWQLARRLAARPGRLAAATLCAFLSAGGMGAGILTIIPLLELILSDGGASLEAIARDRTPWLGESILAALPQDRFISVVWIIGALAGLTLVGATLTFTQLALSASIVVDAIGGIRRDVFRHALHLPLARLAGRSSDALARVINDTEMLMSGFNALVGKSVVQAARAVAGVTVAFFIDWRLTLIALLATPILYIITRKLGKRIRRASRGALRARGELLNASTEFMLGMRAVKAYSAERRALAHFDVHNQAAVRDTHRQQLIRAIASPASQAVTILFLAGLALIASRAIIAGTMELPGFIAALASLGAAGATVRPLSRAIQEVQMSAAAATRIAELLDDPVEPMWDRRDRPAVGAVAVRLPRLPRHHHSIAFENITLTYPGATEPALDGVSLIIPHGSTVAFVGPNGSGKTSLLSLVPRLFPPTSGRVLIDGRDIAAVDLRSLRRQIGVVTQESFLFRGTVRENIAMGRRSPGSAPGDDEIMTAVRKARADDFISRLPGGLDSIIGEQGATLSGGQRQRLAIARAMLRDPAILILDEATSMIDADSEAKIADALAEFSAGRTSLIVAHRLSTVVGADLIVVIDRGAVAATGTHEQLLETSPLYRTLARTQLVHAPA